MVCKHAVARTLVVADALQAGAQDPGRERHDQRRARHVPEDVEGVGRGEVLVDDVDAPGAHLLGEQPPGAVHHEEGQDRLPDRVDDPPGARHHEDRRFASRVHVDQRRASGVEHHDRRRERDEDPDRETSETQPLVAVGEPRRRAEREVMEQVAEGAPEQQRRPPAAEQPEDAGEEDR